MSTEQSQKAVGQKTNAADHLSVTAIVVTTTGDETFEAVLSSLLRQTRSPERVEVVDASKTAALSKPTGSLKALLNNPAVHQDAQPRVKSLGEGVRQVLADRPSGIDQSSWIWLLHDDSIPQIDALDELTAAVLLSPSVAIAGCKQLDQSGQYLVEVGFTTSRYGRRMNGLDEDEVDQGQDDFREDVLAVGTAGMLIRADVWDSLGGPDPALGTFGDGYDLSVRAHLGGHRVVVVPSAKVKHTRRSYFGIDPKDPTDPGDPNRSFFARRLSFLHSQLTSLSLPIAALFALAMVFWGLARSLYRIATKEPQLAWSEIVAPWTALSRIRKVGRARRKARKTRKVTRRSLNPLLATQREVYRTDRDRRLTRRELRGRKQVLNQLELADKTARTRTRRSALTILVLILLALTAIAFWNVLGALFTNTGIFGGALLPSSLTATELWTLATSDWVPADLGYPAGADPLLMLIAALALIVGGSTQLAVNLIVIGSLLICGLGAWFGAGALTRAPWTRLWVAGVWVSLPATMLGLTSVRIGALVAIMALPWAGLLVARAVGIYRVDPQVTVYRDRRGRPAGSLAGAAGAGLVIAVACSGAPILLPAIIVMVALVAAVSPGRRWRLVWAILPALVLLGPLLRQAIDNPRILAGASGMPLPWSQSPLIHQIFGVPESTSPWPGFEGLELTGPLLCGAILAVLAVLGLFRSKNGATGAVRLGILFAAIGAVVALGASHTVVAVGTTSSVAGWPGVGTAIVVFGLLIAVVAGGDGIRSWLSQHSFGWRQIFVVTAVIAGVAVPITSIGAWGWQLISQEKPLSATEGVLPAVAVEQQRSQDRTRVLMLQPNSDGTITAQLVRFDGPNLVESSIVVGASRLSGELSEPKVGESDQALTALTQAVGNLVGGSGVDPSQELAKLGAGSVLVPANTTSPQRSTLVAHLGSLPGLEKISENNAGDLWRVTPPGQSGIDGPQRVARIRIEAKDGTQIGVVSAGVLSAFDTIPAGPSGRTLVLAERSDPGWKASLDGVPLRESNQDWAQGFELPAEGGQLALSYESRWSKPWLILQVVVFALAALLALPIRRRFTSAGQTSRAETSGAETGEPDVSEANEDLVEDLNEKELAFLDEDYLDEDDFDQPTPKAPKTKEPLALDEAKGGAKELKDSARPTETQSTPLQKWGSRKAARLAALADQDETVEVDSSNSLPDSSSNGKSDQTKNDGNKS